MSASKNINAEKIQGNLGITSISANTISATTIYSGSTDVSSLFKDWTLKTDFNSHTGNTSNPHQVTASQVGAYTTSQTNSLLNTKANLSGATFTGAINAPTIQSGGTDLYNIFVTEDTIDITRVQPGTNITTGGTPNNPIVNVVSSPSFNNILFSGVSTGGDSVVTNLSATTISASTISLSSLSSTTSATTFNDIVIDSNGNVLNNNLFDISINFIDIETWNYRAPEDFKIYNIINPDGLNLTIDVNSSGYTTGDTIVYLDTVEITPDATGFIKLNCEKL